jgi:hypothetical protein
MIDQQPPADKPTQEPLRPEGLRQEDKPKETIREIHHHHYQDKSRGLPIGRIAFGLVLVFIGLVYLAQSTGWINVNINFDWWKLWPLLIIFWGLSMLGGRHWLSGTIGIAIVVAILVMVGLLIFNSNTTTNAPASKTISIAKDAAVTAATVDIKAGAGKLTVGSSTDQLVSGTFESNATSLTTSSTVNATTQAVELKEESYNWHGFGNLKNDLNIKLNKDLPIKLSVDSGASDINLDLKDILAEAVDIDTGASSMKLELGDKTTTSTLNIDAGASSLNLSLPKTLGAKLMLDTGLSSKDLPDFKKIDEKNYESENYNSTDKKLNITLKMGVSSLNINWR